MVRMPIYGLLERLMEGIPDRIPDFGLLDKLYLLKTGTGEDPKEDFDNWDITPEKPIDRSSDNYWFCFLPSLIGQNPKILPREGNIFRYFQPPRVGSSIEGKTSGALRRIVDVAYEEILGLGLKREQINFMSISIGNAPAFYLAGNGLDVNRIVSVVPGGDLRWCLQNSIGTREVAKSARRKEYYHEDLAAFSPGINIETINPSTRIDFWLGGRDNIVPYESQRALADKAIDIMDEGKVTVDTYAGAGHIQTVKRFVRCWQ